MRRPMIVDELLEHAADKLREREIADLRIGLTYTAVLLDDSALGVAATQVEWPTPECRCADEAGRLPRRALDVASLVRAANAVDSAVGLATINAALNSEEHPEEGEGDLLEFLHVSPSDTVAMVGHFGPFVRRLRDYCTLHVFERQRYQAGTLPDWAAERLLPDADVAIITASTLINKTLDHLLELAARVPRVALAGPTTPLAPAVFAPRNVHLLAGMAFTGAEPVLTAISQAGGTPSFSQCARKVTLRL